MLDMYEKEYIKDVKHKINEVFPSADKSLKVINKHQIYPLFNKILDILFETDEPYTPIDIKDKTINVIKRLKKLGLEDDEINEIRDIYIKIYKNALDKILPKYYPLSNIRQLDDLYKINKTLFSLYDFDPFYKKEMLKNKNFMKELNDRIIKDFKYTYEARLKNRQYGKIEEADDPVKKKNAEQTKAMVKGFQDDLARLQDSKEKTDDAVKKANIDKQIATLKIKMEQTRRKE